MYCTTSLCTGTLQLGPNASIGEGCVIGAGVRVRDSIVLKDATLGVRSQLLLQLLFYCTLGLV